PLALAGFRPKLRSRGGASMRGTELRGRSGRIAVAGYLAVWGLATAYLAVTDGDWVFPFASLIIFGLILGGLVWFLTRRTNAPAVPVERPRREAIGLLVYLAFYAVILIAIGLGRVQQAIPPGQTQELAVLGYKLLIHVAIPAGIILLLGGTLR